jgi:hypothetical protein
MKTRFFAFILVLFFSFFLQADQPFIVITPEKTGTHLLTKVMERMSSKKTRNCWAHSLTHEELLKELKIAEENEAFLHMHALPTDEIINTLLTHSYKVIFLMRDPRDVIISLLFYIDKGWTYGPFRRDYPYGKLSFDEKLDELISGSRYGLSALNSIIGRRIPWIYQDVSFVYVAHFENLVGDKGGGTDQAQLEEILNIANFLNIKLDKEKIDHITYQLFGIPGERTFRSGQIHTWKKYFKPFHIEKFKNRFGNELILLGYEKDFIW